MKPVQRRFWLAVLAVTTLAAAEPAISQDSVALPEWPHNPRISSARLFNSLSLPQESAYTFELELSATSTILQGVSPSTIWAARVHVDATQPTGPATLRLVLDPAVWNDGSAHFISGLTEAYLLFRGGSTLLSAGVERIPLEVGRLTLPFSIEPVDALGERSGLAGMRVIWYPDESTRLRLALVEHQESFTPLLSVRRQFPAFELEGHILGFDGRTALALGASGLAGRVVMYGEIWALTSPQDWRYAFGVSGSIRGGIWTVETGYASVLPGHPPRHQVAAQLAQQLWDNQSLSLTGRLFWDPDAVRSQAGAEYTRTFNDYELKVLVGGQFGPEPAQGTIETVLRIFF